jgi:hypothetical protein
MNGQIGHYKPCGIHFGNLGHNILKTITVNASDTDCKKALQAPSEHFPSSVVQQVVYEEHTIANYSQTPSTTRTAIATTC